VDVKDPEAVDISIAAAWYVCVKQRERERERERERTVVCMLHCHVMCGIAQHPDPS
jgi:hypothetical protein